MGGVVYSSSGRLEFCFNGIWGTVCNLLKNWSPGNVHVACRQLGFSSSGKNIILLLLGIYMYSRTEAT